jgi:hypothetical protein
MSCDIMSRHVMSSHLMTRHAPLIPCACCAMLAEYFSTSHASRDNVLHSLTQVLEQLPPAMREHFITTREEGGGSSAPITFEPELSSREQSMLENRYEYLQKMTAEMKELQEYLDDVDKLSEEFGSSATGVPAPPSKVPSGVGGPGGPATDTDTDTSLDSEQAQVKYMAHLDSMSKCVLAVQRRLSEVYADMTAARTCQDDLYDACQKVCLLPSPALLCPPLPCPLSLILLSVVSCSACMTYVCPVLFCFDCRVHLL